MDLTRRKFLSLASASVGAIAFGGMAAKAGAPEPLPPLVVAEAGPINDIGTCLTVEDLRRARDMLDANDAPHGLQHLESQTVTVLGDGKHEFRFAVGEPYTIEMSKPVAHLYVGVPHRAGGAS